MRWLELSVKAPPEFVEPLSQIFHRYGHGGVVLEYDCPFSPDEGERQPPPDTVSLKTYLPLNSTSQERRHRIDLGVRLVAHVSTVSPLQERVLEEEGWHDAFREHFQVLRIGRRIVVRPPWRDYASTGSDVVLTLDPGMAFGTGHHPTTRRCLELLEDLVKPGMAVLDVGCGSGILSIAAAMLGAKSVFALETDSVAAGVAKRNTRENGVDFSVQVTEGTLPHPDVREHGFDVGVANISARVVSEMAGELRSAVRSGGKIIASGVLVGDKESVTQALESAGGLVDGVFIDGDWVTLLVSVT